MQPEVGGCKIKATEIIELSLYEAHKEAKEALSLHQITLPVAAAEFLALLALHSPTETPSGAERLTGTITGLGGVSCPCYGDTGACETAGTRTGDRGASAHPAATPGRKPATRARGLPSSHHRPQNALCWEGF